MKNKLTGLAVGASLIIGGGTVDLVPVSIPASAWGQYRVAEAPIDIPAWEEKTASGTISHPAYIAPLFRDDNKNGVVSYSVAINKKGKRVYTQITDEEYAKLGGKDGATFNKDYPAIDKITLAEAALEGLMPEIAEAAIAYDSGNNYTSCASGTSCTYSFTNTAGDLLIANDMIYNVNPGTITISYNGVSMTSMSGGVNQTTTEGNTPYAQSFYLASPSTGANNLVITTGNTVGGFYAHAISYSGTNTATPVRNIVLQTRGLIGATDTCAITINDTTNSWAGWFGLVGTRARTYTANAGTYARTAVGDSQTWVYDSNTVANTNPYTLSVTNTGGDEGKVDTCFEIVMASASTPTPAPIIEPIITWW